VNIDGVNSVADFEVIKILDDSQPYPELMGLEWAFDNQAIINLNRREMIFEVRDLKVTAPLDPTEGKRYIEPIRGNNINNLYNMTAWMDDYVNPTTNGVLSWRSISSCASHSEEGLEHFQQRMHEVSMRQCARITRALHWIGTELYNPPKCDGLKDISLFAKAFELKVPEKQMLLALYLVLKVSPSRWWVAHKEGMEE
jgi:hypothetical protein